MTTPTLAPVEALQQGAALLGQALQDMGCGLLSDDDALELLSTFESVGRLADAGRVMVASTIADRSNRWLG
ncbi:MAG TPA: hypothetical protein VEX88_00155, partial [Glaciibacter sp.]|nr:hypothetical protein [Glaciibacter sp.]